MEYRPFYMARYWAQKGHQVSIIASSQSHVRKIQPKTNGQVTHEKIEGIDYHWIKTPSYHGNGIKRILNMFMFVIKLLLFHKRFIKSIPDVVIASSTYPLDIYPAWLISKKYQAKLVFELHDLWPLSPMELGGYSKWHPFIVIMKMAENFTCKHVDKYISILPKACNYLEKQGLKREKFIHIPNGIELKEWEDTDNLPENLERLLKQLKNIGAYIIGYTGAHGEANSLDTVIRAAADLNKDNVHFILIGNGPLKGKLKKLKEVLGINNVHFVDAISKKSIPLFLKSCDALYIGLKKCSLFRFGISPNKLLDYMMAGRPVIHAIESGNNYVLESGCGISVSAEDHQAVINGIRKLLVMDSKDREKMGENGHNFLLKNFNYQVLSEKFLEHLS